MQALGEVLSDFLIIVNYNVWHTWDFYSAVLIIPKTLAFCSTLNFLRHLFFDVGSMCCFNLFEKLNNTLVGLEAIRLPHDAESLENEENQEHEDRVELRHGVACASLVRISIDVAVSSVKTTPKWKENVLILLSEIIDHVLSGSTCILVVSCQK